MGQRILVVDDSPENRFIVKACLSAEGFVVEEVSSGEELLDLGSKIREFDLILLDVMMPTLNGYETCKRLRNQNLANNVPVIFLSAETDEDSRVSGFEAGGIDYILKPFGRKELSTRIKSHLTMSGTFQAIKKENDVLSANLREGASIQASFLPSTNYTHPKFNIIWDYKPVEHIAGDLFGFINFDDGSLGVYLLDVCGHGSSAALVASAVHGALSSNKDITSDTSKGIILPLHPNKVIENLNREFPFERFERFFTFVYMLYRIDTKKMYCSAAGHPAPYLISKNDSSVIKLPIIGKILGLSQEDKWDQIEVSLSAGDKLIMFSDGILELKSKTGDVYENRLSASLNLFKEYDYQMFMSGIKMDIDNHSKDIDILDDRSIIILELK